MKKDEMNMQHEVAEELKIEQKNNKRIHHNALLILKKYNKVKWRIEESLDDLEHESLELTDSTLTQWINTLVDIDIRVKESRINSRLESIEYSKSILDFVDQALAKVKRYPDHGPIFYQILDQAYINRKPIPLDLVADEIGLSRPTFYREKKKALALFEVTLWGYF